MSKVHHHNNNIQSQIEVRAKEIGSKASNLVALKDLVNEFNEQQTKKGRNSIKLTVPEFSAIPNDTVVEHLNIYADGWRELWDQFCAIQKANGNNQIITSEAQIILESLQTKIKQAFDNNTLALENLPANSPLFMVRSTGNEDREDIRNQGGNESVPSKKEDLSHNIGVVVASYFSTKSLTQRLQSGDNITEVPLIPCLVQKLVGENLDNKNAAKPVISGIVYNGRTTRIQAAPGHGERVANNSGPTDNYNITSQNMVYPQIREKSTRLVPHLDQITNKITLVEAVNDDELAQADSLGYDVAIVLAEFGRFVQEKFGGVRRDIEFVYNPSTNEINIVQNAPIPEGSRKGKEPSALSNEYISQKKPESLEGIVGTPDILSASVITDSSEIVIRNTIEEAVKKLYNDKDGKIKTIIVQEPVDDTSHWAGFCSTRGVSILQVSDISKTQDMISQLKENNIICDPQHNAIFQIKKSEFRQDLIKEGIFKSTLTPYVSAPKRMFAAPNKGQIQELQTPESLGNLLHQANQDGSKSQELFSYLFKIIEQNAEPKFHKIPEDHTIQSYLKLIERPDLSGDIKLSIQAQKKILANVMSLALYHNKNGDISSELFKQIILTGAEVLIDLDKVATNQDQTKAKDLMADYLDVYQKFQGLVIGQAPKNMLTNSMISEVRVSELYKDARALFKQNGIKKALPNQISTLSKALSINHLIISDEGQKQWKDFCGKICKTTQGAYKLGQLLNTIEEQGITGELLNFYMLNALQKHGENHKALFDELNKEVATAIKEATNINKAEKVINLMEEQISTWDDPSKFESLYKKFQDNLKNIDENLQFKTTDSEVTKMIVLKNLYKLIDVIDKTIKRVERSGHSEQQVENFYKMIGDMQNVMEKWLKVGGYDDQVCMEILLEMKKFYNTKQDSLNYNETEPSGYASVDGMTIPHLKAIDKSEQVIGMDQGLEGWKREFTGRKANFHLEDYFSLLHQNLIGIMGKLGQNSFQALSNNLPSLLKNSHKQVISERLAEFMAGEIAYPEIRMHYNIPLRSHSGHLDVTYNQKTKKIKLNFEMFGHNLYERWDKTTIFSYLALNSIAGVKITRPPSHDVNNRTVGFEVEFDNEEQFNKITPILTQELSRSKQGPFDGQSPLIYDKVSLYDSMQLLSNEKLEEMIKFIKENYHSSLADKNDGIYFLKACKYIKEKSLGNEQLLEILNYKHGLDSAIFKSDSKQINFILNMLEAPIDPYSIEILFKSLNKLQEQEVNDILKILAPKINADSMLRYAIKNDNPALVKWSLEQGANINGMDDKTTPLILALNSRNQEIIDIIMSNNPNVNKENPILKAGDNVELAGRLIKLGADVNATDKENSGTLLMIAVKRSLPLTTLLINSGAKIDIRDTNGKTALHHALQQLSYDLDNQDQLNTVKFLISKEADILELLNQKSIMVKYLDKQTFREGTKSLDMLFVVTKLLDNSSIDRDKEFIIKIEDSLSKLLITSGEQDTKKIQTLLNKITTLKSSQSYTNKIDISPQTSMYSESSSLNKITTLKSPQSHTEIRPSLEATRSNTIPEDLNLNIYVYREDLKKIEELGKQAKNPVEFSTKDYFTFLGLDKDKEATKDEIMSKISEFEDLISRMPDHLNKESLEKKIKEAKIILLSPKVDVYKQALINFNSHKVAREAFIVAYPELNIIKPIVPESKSFSTYLIPREGEGSIKDRVNNLNDDAAKVKPFSPSTAPLKPPLSSPRKPSVGGREPS